MKKYKKACCKQRQKSPSVTSQEEPQVLTAAGWAHNADLNSQLQEKVETGDNVPQTPCRGRALTSRNNKMNSSAQQWAMTTLPISAGTALSNPPVCTLAHPLEVGAPRHKAVPVLLVTHLPCSAPQETEIFQECCICDNLSWGRQRNTCHRTSLSRDPVQPAPPQQVVWWQLFVVQCALLSNTGSDYAWFILSTYFQTALSKYFLSTIL